VKPPQLAEARVVRRVLREVGLVDDEVGLGVLHAWVLLQDLDRLLDA
jgi:hypothetical protein